MHNPPESQHTTAPVKAGQQQTENFHILTHKKRHINKICHFS